MAATCAARVCDASDHSSSAYSWYTACESLSSSLDETMQLLGSLHCIPGAQEQQACAEHQALDTSKPAVSLYTQVREDTSSGVSAVLNSKHSRNEPSSSNIIRGLRHSGQSTPLPEVVASSPVYCHPLQTITPPASMDVHGETCSSKIAGTSTKASKHLPLDSTYSNIMTGPQDTCKHLQTKRVFPLDLEILQQAIARHRELATASATNGQRRQCTALYTPVTTTMHTTLKLQGLPAFNQQEFQHITNKVRSDIETAVARSWPGARIPAQIFQRGCIFVAITLVGVMTPFMLMRNRRSSQINTFTGKHVRQHKNNSLQCDSSDVAGLQQHMQNSLEAACSDAMHMHAIGKVIVASAVQAGPGLPLPAPQRSIMVHQEQSMSSEAECPPTAQVFVDAAMNLLTNDLPGNRTSNDSAVHMGWCSNPDNLVHYSSSSNPAYAGNAISAPSFPLPQNPRRRSSSAARGFSGAVSDADLQPIDENGSQLPSMGGPEKAGTANVIQSYMEAMNLRCLDHTASGQLLLWPDTPCVTITDGNASEGSTAPTILSIRISSVESLKHQETQMRQPPSTGLCSRPAKVLVIQGDTVLCQQTLELPSNITSEDCLFNVSVPSWKLKPGSATVLVFEELTTDISERDVQDTISDYGRNPPAFFQLADVVTKLNILAACTLGCFSHETCFELEQLWADMQAEVVDQWSHDVHDMPPPQRLLSALAWCHSYAPFLSDIQLLIERPARVADVQSDNPNGSNTTVRGLADEQPYQVHEELKEAVYSVLAFMASRNMKATAAEVLKAGHIELRYGGQSIQGLPFDMNVWGQLQADSHASAQPAEHDLLHGLLDKPFMYDIANEAPISLLPARQDSNAPLPTVSESVRNHSTGRIAHVRRISEDSGLRNSDTGDAVISSQSHTAPSLPLSAPISHTSMYSACSTTSRLPSQVSPLSPLGASTGMQSPFTVQQGIVLPVARTTTTASRQQPLYNTPFSAARTAKPSFFNKVLCCFSASS